MRRYFFLIFLLMLALFGCAGHLRPDMSEPAISAGYPTAEFEVSPLADCTGQLGLMMCSVKKGEDMNNLGVAIRGHYSGTVRVVSTDCQLDKTLVYQGSQSVRIDMPTEAVRNCLFSVTLNPEFPEKQQGGIVVYGFRGHLAVRVTGGEPWLGGTRIVSGAFKSDLHVPVQGGAAARVVFRGCGVKYEASIEPKAGFVTIPLQDAVSSSQEPFLCVLDGFVMNQDNDLSLNVLIAVYQQKYTPLAIPSVQKNGRSIKVLADPQVSIVALDGEYVMDRQASFEFDPMKDHRLRALTVKGRAVLGRYSPEIGWVWEQ